VYSLVVTLYAVSIDALVSPDARLLDLVEAVRALPYGRPSDRTVGGMLRERRGTCSTKHLVLAQALRERFPETEPLIVHRVYTLDRARAAELFGAAVAEMIPEHGLVDVHRYLTIALKGQRVAIDATFAGPTWDGRSSLPLMCGPGSDYAAGEDPDAEKRALEDQHCEPSVREPFIVALSAWWRREAGDDRGVTAPSGSRFRRPINTPGQIANESDEVLLGLRSREPSQVRRMFQQEVNDR
jgi:hypothetical protein